MPTSEVYFEHRRIGMAVKCTAIDGATGTEVSVSGPATALPYELERLALRALERRLAKSDKADERLF